MPRQKNNPLPGLEQKKIAEITKAAEAYVEVRDPRMDLTRKEHDKKGELIQLMKKHGLTSYRDDDLSIELIPGKDTLKVKVGAEPEEDPELE